MNLRFWSLLILWCTLYFPSMAQTFFSFGDSLRYPQYPSTLFLRKASNPFQVNTVYQYQYLPTFQYFTISKPNNTLSEYNVQQYLNREEFNKITALQSRKKIWKTITPTPKLYPNVNMGNWIDPITVNSTSFSRIFGGNTIEIIPKGNISLSLKGHRNANENPLLNERNKKLWGIEFDQEINLNILGKIGEQGRITANFSSQGEFDFDNFIKFDYYGKQEDILQRLEIGNVNFVTPTQLMSSTESLFGVKAQLQIGKINITGVISQRNAEQREIILSSGQLEREIKFSLANYEYNQHFFLAQYFRENYNKSLQNPPLVNSPIQINTIEVWVSNTMQQMDNTREILALMDIGENNPYHPLIIGNALAKFPHSGLPTSDGSPLSNNLLNLLGDLRNPNSTTVSSFFNNNGGSDNYIKLTNARKLIEGLDYTVNRKLGYISLHVPLEEDQILSVAYRYTANGKDYQVGDLSTDIPYKVNNPSMLITKLLKNDVIKTNLPTWNLMMKNIYNLGTPNITPEDIKLNIVRTDTHTAIESPIMYEGLRLENKSWLEVTGLDRLAQNTISGPDGNLDFIEGITIDKNKGKLIFPLVEPFGQDLADLFNTNESTLAERYVFEELYRLTQVDAIQHYSNKNRYSLIGSIKTSNNTEFSLGVFNLRPNTVKVYYGTIPLQESTDYSIDYESGNIRILNPLYLMANNSLRVVIEDSSTWGQQQKTFLGSRIDYAVNRNTKLGATFIKLIERPYSEKAFIGVESISNTMLGADLRYNKELPWITRLLDKLPFYKTNENSSINFYGEFAYKKPGYARALNTSSHGRGTAYLDDFENNFSFIDIKNQQGWQIAPTPQLFPEHHLHNDLSYGFNRALLSFYNIDPIFYQSSHLNPRIDSRFLTDHRSRRITEQEVFPFKESKTGTDIYLPTLDLVYYPMLRGPYNYNANDLDAQGFLVQPKSRWGGIFKKIDQPDFEAQNIEFLEMWLLDPKLTNPNKEGGDLYINLGNITEDILKDGKLSAEYAIPANGDKSSLHATNWGYTLHAQPISKTFENTDQGRLHQDVGLDALNNEEEKIFFKNYLNQLRSKLTLEAYDRIEKDPSNDDYIYFKSSHFSKNNGILERYQFINGSEGNSKTSKLSQEAFGTELSARTLLPDGEDISRDHILNSTDTYYEYQLSLKTEDFEIGKNHIVDEHTSTVQIGNNKTDVKWFKIRIPIRNYKTKYGNINGFKSIKYVRLFFTNFADTAVYRFANMQFVRSDWRTYNPDNVSGSVLADPILGQNPSADNSTISTGYINIEENGKRTPIPYVLPPTIHRQVDYSNNNLDVQLNEQSLSVNIQNLKDGYARAVFKNTSYDLRQYGKLEWFVHAEGPHLRDNDAYTILRLGTDDQQHYYQFEAPLKVTPEGSSTPQTIWPHENNIVLDLNELIQIKLERDKATWYGQAWPLDKPFEVIIGNNKITVVGSPDLSKVKFYMLGIKNPAKGQFSAIEDDGRDISGEFWFNELRLTDLNSKSSWAATAQLNIKLADLGNIAVSGTKITAGFGDISQRLFEQERTNKWNVDFMANAELGKLTPGKLRLFIPLYFNFSKQIGTPEYDPFLGDVLLKRSLESLTSFKQDSLLRLVQEYTLRRNISFLNVRKLRDNIDKIKPWQIENFAVSYQYNELQQRDLYTYSALHKNYRASVDYNYTTISPEYKYPFKNHKLLSSFNYNLMPNLLSFRLQINRVYQENTFRDNSNNNILPTYYNKNFNMSRLYGVSWDLTNNLRLDFNATNYAIIEEPDGRIDGARKDTLWTNFWRLGTNMDYNHMMNLTYNIPIHKIPYMEWLTISTRYGSQFNWQSEPLSFLRNENIDLGNSIQNNRTIQINPTANFNKLYQKVKFFRNNKKSFWIGLISAVKYANGAYTRIEGAYLPGYLPESHILGYNFKHHAPGWDFIFGNQINIRQRALEKNWLTTDTLQQGTFTKSYAENLSALIHAEPIKHLKIDLTISKTDNSNTTSPYQNWTILPDYTTGSYSISQAHIKGAFSNMNKLYKLFLEDKLILSESLGAYNPNSLGSKANFFRDGYDEQQQDVVVNAFLKRFLNKRINIAESNKPAFPLPNWRLNYTGLSQLLKIEDYINTIHIHHAFQSAYSIASYHSNTNYQREDNFPFIRDGNGNFIPQFQYSQINLTQRFLPLIGTDIRFRNNWSINSEYRHIRDVSLSLESSIFSIFSEQSYILGVGYRKLNAHFPFGLFQYKNWKSDVNFHMDIALNDRKLMAYRTGNNREEVTGGNRNITVNPSLEYTINRLYNIRLYYNTNAIKPYTSQNFASSNTYIGVNFRILLQ